MRIVSKKWIFDNLSSSSNVNTTVSDTVKNIIKDIKKNKDEALLKYVRTVSYTHLRAHETLPNLV